MVASWIVGERWKWTRGGREERRKKKNKKGRKVDVSSVRKRLIRRDRGSLRCERLLHSKSIRHTHTGLLYICMKRGAQNYRRILATCSSVLSFFPSFPPLFSRAESCGTGENPRRYRFDIDFRAPREPLDSRRNNWRSAMLGNCRNHSGTKFIRFYQLG